MKLAIFDLGNVLFRIDFKQALVFCARKSGISLRTLLGRVSVGPEFEAFERGELSETRFFGWLARTLQVNLSARILVQGWNSIYGPVIRPAYEAMRRLSGFMPMVALTNTNATHQLVWQMLYEKELAIFKKVYVSSELGMRKPEKRIYALVIEDWRVPPEETVFFDDLQENIKAAAEMGIAAQLVTSDTTVTRWVNDYLSS